VLRLACLGKWQALDQSFTAPELDEMAVQHLPCPDDGVLVVGAGKRAGVHYVIVCVNDARSILHCEISRFGGLDRLTVSTGGPIF
jgi:hypothetical protein